MKHDQPAVKHADNQIAAERPAQMGQMRDIRSVAQHQDTTDDNDHQQPFQPHRDDKEQQDNHVGSEQGRRRQ